MSRSHTKARRRENERARRRRLAALERLRQAGRLSDETFERLASEAAKK